MSGSISKWVLAVACFFGVATSGVVFAQIGPGGFYGGYGGFGGYGRFGGYGGYGFGSGYGPGYGLPYGLGYGYGYGLPYGLAYGGYGYGLGYGGWGYGLGYGGWGYGLGYGGWGYGFPGYGFGYGYPWGGWGGWGWGIPLYYNYNQQQLANPIYSQPVYSNSPYTGITPVLPSSPMMSGAPQSGLDEGEIVLFSPASNTAEVQYKLNGAPYVMKPGTLQRFMNDRVWIIDVNNGNGLSTKFTLSGNNYKFKPNGLGMGLVKTQDSPDSIMPGNIVPQTVSPSLPVAPPSEIPPPAPMP